MYIKIQKGECLRITVSGDFCLSKLLLMAVFNRSFFLVFYFCSTGAGMLLSINFILLFNYLGVCFSERKKKSVSEEAVNFCTEYLILY